MTNEQTRILLKSIRERIQQVTEVVAAAMPPETQSTYKKHIQTLGGFCLFCTPEKNPHHYTDEAYHPALEPLENLLQSLDDDIELLKPSESSRKSGAA